MTSDPSSKRLADEATWAAFRAAVAKLTKRQRRGFQLALLRQQALQGDSHAAKQFELLLAEARRGDAIDAYAAEIKNDNPGLDDNQATCLAMAALSRNSENDTDE